MFLKSLTIKLCALVPNIFLQQRVCRADHRNSRKSVFNNLVEGYLYSMNRTNNDPFNFLVCSEKNMMDANLVMEIRRLIGSLLDSLNMGSFTETNTISLINFY